MVNVMKKKLNLKKSFLFLMLMIISCASLAESAGGTLIKQRLQGLSYSGSADARENKTTLLVHDCWGNKFDFSGNINKVEVTDVDSKTINVHVWYRGNYLREKYNSPCVKVTDEKLNPSGEILFDVKLGVLGAKIIWGEIRNLSPVGGIDHDSNGYTVSAIKNAITGKMAEPE
jgi:hypothetical protein